MSVDPTSTSEEVGQLLVRSLGLLMADEVELSSLDIIEEPHKGTRGGPSDRASAPLADSRRLVELSHPIRAGMVTLPGLPGPEISLHLTREASKANYAEGTTFEIGRISMVANTGTYVDSPLHRFAQGADLSGMPLEQLADLETVVVRVAGSPCEQSTSRPCWLMTCAARRCCCIPAMHRASRPRSMSSTLLPDPRRC